MTIIIYMQRVLWLGVWLFIGSTGWSAEARTGQVEFAPSSSERMVAPQFRLNAHQFTFQESPRPNLLGLFSYSEVIFPSPVETPHPNNNLVHCEYFRPLASGKRPGVIVLHILGGDFELSRLCCRTLAAHGTGALFVKMPYYGPRRQPGNSARMISADPRETVRGMTQAVLDIRRAAAWLADQEEIDANQLGITGISLGGIVSALGASAEPRFTRVCLVLAGGDVGQVAWDAPELRKIRDQWQSQGISRESLGEMLRPIDPVTYAQKLHGRKVLMINAKYDEVIPRSCTESLWTALGKPEIIWWDAGHYSALVYLPDGLQRMANFFGAD